jgi:hypothetical protein
MEYGIHLSNSYHAGRSSFYSQKQSPFSDGLVDEIQIAEDAVGRV